MSSWEGIGAAGRPAAARTVYAASAAMWRRFYFIYFLLQQPSPGCPRCRSRCRRCAAPAPAASAEGRHRLAGASAPYKGMAMSLERAGRRSADRFFSSGEINGKVQKYTVGPVSPPLLVPRAFPPTPAATGGHTPLCRRRPALLCLCPPPGEGRGGRGRTARATAWGRRKAGARGLGAAGAGHPGDRRAAPVASGAPALSRRLGGPDRPPFFPPAGGRAPSSQKWGRSCRPTTRSTCRTGRSASPRGARASPRVWRPSGREMAPVRAGGPAGGQPNSSCTSRRRRCRRCVCCSPLSHLPPSPTHRFARRRRGG